MATFIIIFKAYSYSYNRFKALEYGMLLQVKSGVVKYLKQNIE